MRIFSRPVSFFFSALASALLLTACQTTDDPREGGFIGGVGGLSSGAYERRIQEREDSLERLKSIQRELEKQQSDLEHQQQQSLSAYQLEKQRVTDLSQKAQTLSTRLKAIEPRYEEQESARKKLIGHLDELQSSIDNLAIQDEASMRVEMLERERNALEDEYRLLLEIYREISQ